MASLRSSFKRTMCTSRGISLAFAILILPSCAGANLAPQTAASAEFEFGMNRTFTTLPGKRDAFVAALIDGFQDMPGCRSFIVAKDVANQDTVWVTEVWQSEEIREQVLTSPRIKAATAVAKQYLDRRDLKATTIPVGGQGF